jgi:starch synthase
MVASEASPFYTMSGLANAVGSLAAALVEQGQQVDVILPLYETARPDKADKLDEFLLSVGQSQYQVSVLGIRTRGVRYLLLDVPRLFDQRSIYGQEEGDRKDNGIRFGVFCRAVVETITRRTSQPRVVHCHDWQTGLTPLMLKLHARHEPDIVKAKTVFTVHDLAAQGRFDKFVLPALGLDWSLFNPEQLEFWGDINFLKAGLVFSDLITVASPRYAKDIQTSEWNCGLDGVLRTRKANLVGVLDGVDYEIWNPAKDSHIAQAYSATDLTGKPACKHDLLQNFWFAGDPLVPTIGVVARFDDAAAVDFIHGSAEVLLADNARLVVHGSGDSDLEGRLTQLAKTYPQNIAVVLGFNEVLTHRIHAGADMLLFPERHQPCGLGQFRALRYATIPIISATNSADTGVADEAGFKFDDYTVQALCQTIHEACTAYHERPYHWRRMMIRAMQQDFSWGRRASEYSQAYAQQPPS